MDGGGSEELRGIGNGSKLREGDFFENILFLYRQLTAMSLIGTYIFMYLKLI